MHKDMFVTKWIVSIMSLMGDVCKDGFLIPIHVMFYSEHASYDILKSKRELRIR